MCWPYSLGCNVEINMYWSLAILYSLLIGLDGKRWWYKNETNKVRSKEVIGLLLLKIDLLSFLIRNSVKYTKYKQWNIKRYDIKDYMWPLPPGLYLLIVSHGDFENESELRDHLVIWLLVYIRDLKLRMGLIEEFHWHKSITKVNNFP